MEYSAQEICDLVSQATAKQIHIDLPSSKSGVKIRAEKEGWKSRIVQGKGGRNGQKTVYSLPNDVIKELQAKGLIPLLEKSKLPFFMSLHKILDTLLFIFLFTKKDNSHYPLHTKVSAILLSPIIEEVICREIAYNSDYVWVSYILGTIIFIFFHFAFDFKSIIYFLCMSSLLFLLREQSGSVLNSILLHMMMNITVIYRK